MKKITIDCCFECLYRGAFENGYADCMHEKADGIAIHESNQEYRNIHPDCPLEDEPTKDSNGNVPYMGYLPTGVTITMMPNVFIERGKAVLLFHPDDRLNSIGTNPRNDTNTEAPYYPPTDDAMEPTIKHFRD